MTLFLGYCLSFLVGFSGLIGMVVVYQFLIRLVNPITMSLVKRYPILGKLVVLRYLLILASWLVVPFLLNSYLFRFRTLWPYLADTSIGLSFGVAMVPVGGILLLGRFGGARFSTRLALPTRIFKPCGSRAQAARLPSLSRTWK